VPNFIDKKLRIIQISKYDSAGGGASRVAEQLTDALLSKGHHVLHYSRGAAKGFNNIRRPLYGIRTKKLMGWMAKKGWVDVLPFELPRLLFNFNIWCADVIHFHDISGTASPLTVSILSWFKKVVWTLHDMSIITAGCTYANSCERYLDICQQCPQLGTWPLDTAADKTQWLYMFRRFVYRLSRAHLISPSHWLAEEVSRQLNQIVAVIPNGVDTDVFHADAWNLHSDYLSVNMNKLHSTAKFKVVLSASSLTNPYKGISIALRIIARLPVERLILVIVGNNDFAQEQFDCEVLNFGYINNEKEKAAVFALCDVMLFCSTAENYPLTLLEAIACGLRLIALNAGGVKEIIDLDKSSYCVAHEEDAYTALLHSLSSNDKNKGTGHLALNKISSFVFLEAYEHFYFDLIENINE
jgi:glycosyltransferase involved in cell wall biosynthesis